MSHRHTEIPVAVIATYAVGYVAGRWIAVLWTRGPMDAHGVRRLAGGAAQLAHHRPAPERRAA